MFQLVYVGLIHYCNMSALNYFVKSTIATVCALVVVLLLSPFVCDTLYQEDSNPPLTGFQQVRPKPPFFPSLLSHGKKSSIPWKFWGSLDGKGLLHGSCTFELPQDFYNKTGTMSFWIGQSVFSLEIFITESLMEL